MKEEHKKYQTQFANEDGLVDTPFGMLTVDQISAKIKEQSSESSCDCDKCKDAAHYGFPGHVHISRIDRDIKRLALLSDRGVEVTVGDKTLSKLGVSQMAEMWESNKLSCPAIWTVKTCGFMYTGDGSCLFLPAAVLGDSAFCDMAYLDEEKTTAELTRMFAEFMKCDNTKHFVASNFDWMRELLLRGYTTAPDTPMDEVNRFMLRMAEGMADENEQREVADVITSIRGTIPPDKAMAITLILIEELVHRAHLHADKIGLASSCDDLLQPAAK